MVRSLENWITSDTATSSSGSFDSKGGDVKDYRESSPLSILRATQRSKVNRQGFVISLPECPGASSKTSAWKPAN